MIVQLIIHNLYNLNILYTVMTFFKEDFDFNYLILLILSFK